MTVGFLDKWFVASGGGVNIHVLCMLSVIVVWIVPGQTFPLWSHQTAFARQTAVSKRVAEDWVGIVLRKARREDRSYAMADRGALCGR